MGILNTLGAALVSGGAQSGHVCGSFDLFPTSPDSSVATTRRRRKTMGILNTVLIVHRHKEANCQRWRDKHGQVEVSVASQDGNHLEQIALLDDVYMMDVTYRESTGKCLIKPVIEGPSGLAFPPGSASVSFFLGRYATLVLNKGDKGGLEGMDSFVRRNYFPVVEVVEGNSKRWAAEYNYEVVWKGDEAWLKGELRGFSRRGLAEVWDRFATGIRRISCRRSAAAKAARASSRIESSSETVSSPSTSPPLASRPPLEPFGSERFPAGSIEVINATAERLWVMLVPEAFQTDETRSRSREAHVSAQLCGQGRARRGDRRAKRRLGHNERPFQLCAVMAFFLGDLVVSVCGCSIDEKAGPLLDPRVELSVGNKLHSTTLPVGVSCGGVRAKRGGGKRSRRASSAVAFHGVSETDVLALTVIDRAPSSIYPSSPTAIDDDNGRSPSPASSPPPRPPPPYVAEAEPLLCTDWGAGGRPNRLTCRVAPPPPEEEGVPGETPWRPGVGPAAVTGWDGGGVSTVQLAMCWSPAIRLRRPLSLVVRAGRLTGRVVSGKIDRPVGAALNLALSAADAATGFLLAVCWHPDPRWRAVAVAAAAALLSLGSAVAAAAAAFFWPVVVAAAATAVAVAPAAAVVGWVFACTGPACEQLWRPLLVWTGTRWGFVRRLFLLPMGVEGGEEGEAEEAEGEGSADRGVLLRGQEACLSNGEDTQGWLLASSPTEGQPTPQERSGQNAMVPLDSDDDDNARAGDPGVLRGGRGGVADAGAVVLLLACYQNLIGVLHTGLEASRWRPRPRPESVTRWLEEEDSRSPSYHAQTPSMPNTTAVEEGEMGLAAEQYAKLFVADEEGVDQDATVETFELVAGLSSMAFGAVFNMPFIVAPSVLYAPREDGIEMGAHLADQLVANLAAALFFALALKLSFVAFIPTALRLGAGCGISMLVSVLGLRSLGLLVSNSFTLQPFTWQNMLGLAIITASCSQGSDGANITKKWVIVIVVPTLLTMLVYAVGDRSKFQGYSNAENAPLSNWSNGSFGIASFSELLADAPNQHWFYIIRLIFSITINVSSVLLVLIDAVCLEFRLMACAIPLMSAVGNYMGVTTQAAFVQSMMLIFAGGRSGLSAVVTGAMFALSTALWPLLPVLVPGHVSGALTVVITLRFFTVIRMIDVTRPSNLLMFGISILLIPFSFDFVNALCIATVLGFLCEVGDKLGRVWSAQTAKVNKVAVSDDAGKDELPVASGADVEALATTATAADTGRGAADLEGSTKDTLLRSKFIPSFRSLHDISQVASAPTSPRGELVPLGKGRTLPRNVKLPPIKRRERTTTEREGTASMYTSSSPRGPVDAASSGGPVMVHWGLALVAAMQLVLSVIRDQAQDTSD
eukprot:g5266.t1